MPNFLRVSPSVENSSPLRGSLHAGRGNGKPRVTIRTLIDLLTRVDAWHDAATLYGATASASSGAPPYGADADLLRQTAARLRDHLTGTEFRSCTDQGEQLDGAQVIDLALEAIARAAAKPGAQRP